MVDIEKIYSAYFNDVYRYIRKLSNDEQIAQDITSETFFKAIAAIDDFKNDCDIRVWLCQIAKNTYYSYIKKDKQVRNFEEFELDNIIDNKPSLQHQIITNQQVQLVQKILHTLPEPYKEVFMWRIYADLSFKQIAQIYNKSDNWACVTYHRAKVMLRNKMEEINHE